MNVLSRWFDRILGRSSSGGGAQETTADVRTGDEPRGSAAHDLEEGVAAARDETIARDAPAQPPGAG